MKRSMCKARELLRPNQSKRLHLLKRTQLQKPRKAVKIFCAERSSSDDTGEPTEEDEGDHSKSDSVYSNDSYGVIDLDGDRQNSTY